jgi:hypothetical protein
MLELRERWLIAGLILSMAITVIVASKPGSGPHHFFPFVPLCLYGAIVLLDSPSTEAPRIATIVFLLMLAAYSPGLILQVGHANYYRNTQTELVKVAEFSALLVTYPEAQIGVSDQSHYADTYYKVLSVLRGHPLRVDFAAWMDLQYSGVQENNIIRFVKGCEVPAWILPLGPPFTMVNLYTGRPMLSDEFRQAFSENYRLTEMGNAFQVWVCRALMKQTGSPEPMGSVSVDGPVLQ